MILHQLICRGVANFGTRCIIVLDQQRCLPFVWMGESVLQQSACVFKMTFLFVIYATCSDDLGEVGISPFDLVYNLCVTNGVFIVHLK